jgi:hypothetical protein
MKISIKRTVTKTLRATDRSLGEGRGAPVRGRQDFLEVQQEISRSFDFHWEGKLLSKSALNRVLDFIGGLAKRWFPWMFE